MEQPTGNFQVDLAEDGVALVRLTVSERTLNIITAAVIRDLEALVNFIRSDRIRGVVLTSGRDNGFCAGADLGDMSANIDTWRRATTQAELSEALLQCAALGRHLRALETCGKPVVAAVNGSALGGGLEILLSCHRRIAADDRRIRFAFPESGLGLLPGAGGTQRLLRIVGVEPCLPYLLDGKSMSVQEALALGVVDAVVPGESLIAEARRQVLQINDSTAPWDRKGFTLPGGGIYGPSGYQAFTLAVGRLRKKRFGNYPAQENILKAVYEGSLVAMDAALRIESRYFLKTVRSPQAAAMVRSLFWSMQELGKGTLRPVGYPAFAVKKSAVLGSGMMGAAIAYVHATCGIETTLLDVDQAAADRGKAYAATLFQQAVGTGRLTSNAAAAALALIRPTTEYSRIDQVDIIIEAVFETREIKAAVTRRAEPHLAPHGIFGSNTSTLPIDGLAAASSKPGSFIGIHFFSPVDRMGLVEIIVGARTDQATLAKAIDYVLALRKTPIVVRDSRGFYTSRTFNTYVNEGLIMLEEGIAPAIIDNLGRMTSMPRGPLELADDVALDLILSVEKQTAADLGTKFPLRPEQRILDALVSEHGRYGRKNAKGIYDYPADRGGKTLWPGLAAVAAVRASEVDAAMAAEIRDRLLYRQALEAARCVEEGIISDPRHADIGALLGWGFASWTGGPLSFVDMTGLATFVARADALAAKYGDRFVAPQLLRNMAEEGKTFYGSSSAADSGSS